MVHLKSIWESIWNPFEVCFGVHFRPSGVHFAVHFGSMLRSDSDSGLRPPRDQIPRPLGPILALLLDPMLAPCWQLLGVLGHLGAFLERSRAYLEAILVQHGA